MYRDSCKVYGYHTAVNDIVVCNYKMYFSFKKLKKINYLSGASVHNPVKSVTAVKPTGFDEVKITLYKQKVVQKKEKN